MVRLSHAQEQLIPKLRAARGALDKAVAAIDAEARVKREQVKGPVALIVKEALDAGIPARQVALRGLGYADVSSLRQYLNSELPEAVADFATLTAPVQGTAVASWADTNLEDDEWPDVDVTEADGTIIFSMVGLDTRKLPDAIQVSPNNGWYHYKGEHRSDAQRAINEFLTEQYPDATIEWM